MDDTTRLYAETHVKMAYNSLSKFNDFEGVHDLRKVHERYVTRRSQLRSAVLTAVAGTAIVIGAFTMSKPQSYFMGVAGGSLAVVYGIDAAIYRKKMLQHRREILSIADKVDMKVAQRNAGAGPLGQPASALELSVGTPGGPASVVSTDGDISMTYPGTIGRGTYDG